MNCKYIYAALLLGVGAFAFGQQQDSAKSKTIDEVSIIGVKKYAEKKSDYVAKMPLKNLENPQVYTVLPKELMQQQVATDLQSSLNLLPGVNNVSVSVGSGGVGLGLTMRGFSSNASAGALRNGMATNFVSLSDPVNLEAIEVIKGPSGTLFGSALLVGYGGFVNRVTKKPFNHFKGEVGYTASSWSGNRVTMDINTPLNKEKTFLARINAAYNNDGSFQDFGKSKSIAVAPSFSFKVNDRLDINLDFEYFDMSRNTTYMGLLNGSKFEKKSINDFNLNKKISYASDEIQSKAKILNTYATASYKISDNWTSQTNFSSAKTENDANYLFLNLTDKGNIRRDYYHIPSTFNLTELQQNFIGEFNISDKIKNKLLVGVDYTTIKTTDKRGVLMDIDRLIYKKLHNNSDTGFKPVAFNDENSPYISQAAYQQLLGETAYRGYKRDYKNFSVYASDVISFSDRLFAMASIRYDHFNSASEDYKQDSWSPKLGIVYQIVKDKVSLFGNYMNGFKNITPAGPLYGERRAFKPEKANQWEGGVKYELLGGKLSGTISYYNILVKDKLRSAPTSTDPTFTVQDGSQRSQGIEMDLIASPFHGLNVILGYGYNDSVYEKAPPSVQGRRPAGQARHAGNFWLSYTVPSGTYSGFGFGLGGNAQSKFYIVDSSDVVSNGYVKLDASVFYEKSKYRIALKLNNFTNQQYYLGDSWTSVQNPRQLLLSLNYKF